MNWKLYAVLLPCIAAGLWAALASKSTSEHEVDGQRFNIPNDRLFDARIAWLPEPSNASFTFVLDFAADPSLIPPHMVLVQARRDVCGEGQAQMMRVACGNETTTASLSGKYQKVYPVPDYTVAWDYYTSTAEIADRKESERLQVADCSPIAPNSARPNGTAICTSIWSVNGLVLSLGFEENELPKLRAMRDEATAMLLSWKVR